ncbi:AfsR/SARP family transcriptional regulator [Streptomyces sp. 1331.2]|uniref:AfsR/SARP family transcriptional regulator n=1 Tax=Streptomyces sp. 1331.2 TaxID=1938835 RepID=UPI000BDB467A|nr:BTAD domain-containing putative transcriptional regulator [Streptomyces sp. 1331.2]SOB85569.1 DNA-binding transcriptional activator of the SARP family [Streptomyces sp. 1331.2]
MIQPIRFRLLGPMAAHRDEEGLVVGSPLQQAMMAALLLRDGRAASAGELIEAVWGPTAPASASAMLRTYAWRWRKALERDRSAPVVLTSVGDGYRTVLPAENVDAVRVESLAAAALAATRKAEDHPRARQLLDEALDLWYGEPLAGIPGPLAEQHRARLEDLRISLLEEKCGLDLELGVPGRAVPVLRELNADHPLRERPYVLLMRGLYQSGRQADALAVFERVRRLLAAELGIDPGPELRAMHQRILRNDPSLLPAAPPEPEPSVTARTATGTAPAVPVPAQLPADIADFTGREDELAALHTALGKAVQDTAGHTVLPIAAISGMGGVGKTTVALRVAHRLRAGFPDGQLYADLRGDQPKPAQPGVLLVSFLTALGVAPGAVPETLEDRSRLFRSLLDGRRVLILLDNARDAAQVRPLLPGSARCAVLVTSRTRLFGLATAVQVDLDVFSVDEATGMLAQAAGDDRIDADPAAAGELIRYCGRLPLAIRIVASRLASRPSWSVARLADRLAAEQHRMSELQIGDLAVASAFEWGYRQLTPEQATAFRVVAAVSRPDIGVPVAAVVLGVEQRRAEDLLEALVDAGMVSETHAGRYRYHELLRVFASQLTEPDDAVDSATALSRQLDFLLATATAAFQQVVPGDPIGSALRTPALAGLRFDTPRAAARWVGEEFDTAIAAMQAATAPDGSAQDLRTAADLLIALCPFDADPRYERLAVAAAAVSAAATGRADRHSLGRAEFIRGNLAVQATRLGEATEHCRRAAEACREVGDRVILQQVLNDLGLLAQFQHRFEEAVRLCEEAHELAVALGHHTGRTVTLLNAAMARVRGGAPAEGARVCRELLPALRAEEDLPGVSYALFVLGLAAHQCESYQEAAATFRECLELCRSAGLALREAQARYRLADTLRRLGRGAEAVTGARQAVAECEALTADRDRAHALVVLARALADRGRIAEAREHLTEAEALFDRLELPDGELVRALLADLDAAGAAESAAG